MKRIISVLAVAILFIGWAIFNHEQVGTEAGKRAPDFELKD